MERFVKLCSMATLFLLLGLLPLALAGHNYGEALGKSFLFYEAQRSGFLPRNQRVQWRGNSGLNDGKASGVDLVGGYYDAGDNVKFGLPMAFTVTMMSWSVIEYGAQMASSGELGHAIDAIKWGTDYFIKAHPQPYVLYGEVGDGNTDHYCWQRPEDMTTSRSAYRIDPSHPGSDLAGETAAAMAAASIVFRRYNKAYSNELLNHAYQLFEFADKYRGKYDSSITVAQKYYRSVSGYADELLWAAAWLYKAKLQYLKLIELSRNYLSGTIPKEWESLKLEKLSLLVNRLSGPLPDYLGNMTNLTYLSLENNMFSGTIPATLGNLVNLDTLILSANNLTGELPKELNNLSKLKDLRLSTNNFTGKLPAVLQWENLERLELQASGFEGPIPPSISNLKNLTTLMIGYFKGVTSEFPSLINMKKMTILILNSCNLSGIIPEYIATMENLQILDLSFNSLQGGVPDLKHLENLEFVYLIGNSLSGPFPEWTRNTRDKLNIDLSYNNFSENSVPTNPPGNLNLYRSFERGSHQELAKHLRRCSTDYYSVHINCGGKETRVGKVTFEADEQPSGAAKLLSNKEKWGVSSTGAFQGITGGTKATDYVPNNISILTMNDSELYTTARHSGLSLTYYARCLVNGNYSVTLHFAEIILRNGQSFRSLGQRIFDVYIQDELKVKDFDIEKKAQGVDKETKLPFQNVVVKDRTLEIRLQYAGKGTTAVPFRGSYGPLISAVSVESEFPPPSNNNKRKVIIAVVSAASGMLVILAALYFIWKKYYSRDEISREQELKGLDLQTGFFTYRQIRAATDDFSPANKIGEGGFGAVYKGILLDGTIIAVKQLSPKSKQGNREFVNEIGLISGLQHPNVVRLYGCCIEGNQLLLVYEYMENNSLAHSLFGLNNSEVELDWPTRQRICIGIAKGLAFLHDESALRIVHRDIKATNILLDKELNPKISDFGLAKLDEEENTHISTRVAGTIGYMAPEYALWGYLTYKADVYSFGVVALEIIAGKNNMSHRPSPEYVCLLDWALVLQKKGDLVELVDPKLLISDLNKKEAVRMIKVALLCTNPSPALRPTMSAVVGMLEGSISSEEYSSDPSVYNDGLKFQGLRDKYDELELSVNEAGPKSVSSSSTKETKSHDLYPLSLDSQL